MGAPPIYLDDMRRAERRDVPVQTRLTPSESAALDDFVEWAKQQGVTEATRASALRTFALAGLRAHRETVDEGDGTR